jgi:hypothetical protein
MKSKRDLSLIAVMIIVFAFLMAAAIILSCMKLPEFNEILKNRLTIIEY